MNGLAGAMVGGVDLDLALERAVGTTAHTAAAAAPGSHGDAQYGAPMVCDETQSHPAGHGGRP